MPFVKRTRKNSGLRDPFREESAGRSQAADDPPEPAGGLVLRRVLGLDPGSRHTGFGWIEKKDGRWQFGGAGRISLPLPAPRAARLAQLQRSLADLLGQVRPELVAVELPFAGLSVRSALALAEARGAVLAAVGAWGGPILELTPAEVKLSTAGYGAADKEQVGRMVQRQLALEVGSWSPDALDALAVALTAACRSAFETQVRVAATRPGSGR